MNSCGRCGREVYCSEQKFAIGKVWHTFCFSCYKCRKLLDNCSVYCCAGELFCCSCYYSCCNPCCIPCKPCCPPPCNPCKQDKSIKSEKSCNLCPSCKKEKSSKTCPPSTPCCCPPPCDPCCPPPSNPCCPPPCTPCCPPPCDPCCPPCIPCCPPPSCFICPNPCNPSKPKICCVTTPNPSDPCCSPCPPCTPCCSPCTIPCNPCDPCNPCCTPVPCRPCSDPCCSCCGKQVVDCSVPTTNYRLRKTPPPAPKCIPETLCLEWTSSSVEIMPRCRSCSPRPSCSPCRYQRPGSSCAAPIPRETNNYYSRNHDKKVMDNCKGSCYCPEDCVCPHKGPNGRFACPKSCDPCSQADCPPMRCCPSKKYGRPSSKCCPPILRKCCIPPKCCLPPKYSPPMQSSPPDPCCEPCCDPCCDPCCLGPYCPPPRKPVCYPPVKTCEPSPCERICYYPCPQPCQPKYCTCGSPNPCDCDLNLKRKQMDSERAPCCRRCGRKVYHAEKIMASGGAFHTCCFSCYCCHKPLEVTSVFESQGEIYCKHCYGKYFGIAGYGYGLTLQSPL